MKRLRLLDGPLPLIEIEDGNRLSDFLSPFGDMLAISELTPKDLTADLTPIPGANRRSAAVHFENAPNSKVILSLLDESTDTNDTTLFFGRFLAMS